MALVAYDNSDSSEYEDDNEAIVISKHNGQENQIQNDKEQEQTLFNHLPQPLSGKVKILEEDDEFLHKKAPVKSVKPKPQIMIPSISDFKDVGSTIPTSRPKVNGKKSGLLSILPQPKNSVTSTVKSLIPNNVLKQKSLTNSVKKKEPLPSPKTVTTTSKSIITEYSDESDDEVQNDFFSINKPIDIVPESISKEIVPEILSHETQEIASSSMDKPSRSIESYFKKDEDVLPQQSTAYEAINSEDMNTRNVPETSNSDVVLDEDAILKLCGSRGKRKREEIQIVDINQQEVLNEAREMLLKGLMDDTSKRQSASKKRGNEPTSQQRRKHQITYLAHQAKANEMELQNQWANNRMTKRKTQSKYGF